MTLSIDPLTYIISIPKTDLTLIGGTIYSLDTDNFRLALKSWEDSEVGITQPKTHNHNTAVTIAGTTYARSIEILAPYSIRFEDGQYTVILQGSNNNIFDVANGILVQNQVQIISTNSAGLISVTSGTGISAQDKLDIADAVWDEEIVPAHTGSNTAGEYLYGAGGGSSPTAIADAVWNTSIVAHTGSNTFGEKIAKKLLTFTKWIGLK